MDYFDESQSVAPASPATQPGPKYYPRGGRREAAARERDAISAAIASVVANHASEPVTGLEIFEWVASVHDPTPTLPVVRDAVRKMARSDPRFLKVGRDLFAWTPDGHVASRPASAIPPRVLEMIELRRNGLTLDEVGTKFGVTRERVRQLMKKHGGPDASEIRQLHARRVEADAGARAAEVGNAIRAVLAASGPLSPEQVVAKSALERDEVLRWWPNDLIHLRLRTIGNYETHWTDQEFLDAIREAALYEFPLTVTAYHELLTVGQIKGPSVPRFNQKFGSWTKACDAAGVIPGPTMRDNYESRWSDDDLLHVLRLYLEDPRQPNSMQGFDPWKRTNAPDGPSGQTLRLRFGSWTEAKRLALSGGISGE